MEPKKPKLIIVNGLPASGKTTLASFISQELSIPAFHKDTFKELLSDHTGVISIRGSRKFDKPSYALLFHNALSLLKYGVSVIIEGNFMRTEQLEEFVQKLDETGIKIIEIFCTARGELLIERYRDRAEERHPVHERSIPPRFFKILEKNNFHPLGFGEMFEVDTSDPAQVSYQDIVRFIQADPK
ncbi:ATP-binding protein [bacterium]|nr:ATP-binding protein [bacterium]